MSKIRCIIVDDEPLAREGMRELLAPATEIEITAECSDGFQAIAACEQQNPHLLFLDVQMPEMDGFEVAAAVSANHPPPVIIFITAFDEYALRAFNVHALDYLLKPVGPERFQIALARARALIQGQHSSLFHHKMLALLQEQTRQNERHQRWLVKSGKRMLILHAGDIDWIEIADEYALLHAHGKKHLLRTTMNMLEQQLDPEKFVRIHRSTIVNVERIKEMQSQSHGDLLVILRDGTNLKMSRNYRHKLAGVFQYLA
ncbi:MAG: LytR/AlgR family response regulator transcription factor [bacterium]